MPSTKASITCRGADHARRRGSAGGAKGQTLKIGKELTALVALAMVLLAMVGYGAIVRSTSGFPFACDAPCIDGQDLQAQQSMAAAAWWMLAATIMATLLSAGALIALVSSLRQTRRAIADTRDIGEHQTQAYVHAETMTGSLANGVMVTVANTGLTPASHFSVTYSAQVVRRGEVFRQYHFRRDRFVTYSALGPGERLSVGLAIPATALTREGLFHHGGDLLLITGTILYVTVFNHDYETQFVFFGQAGKNGIAFQRSPSNLRTFNRLGPEGLRPSQYTPAAPVIDLSHDDDPDKSP